jgi:hypothetical protein
MEDVALSASGKWPWPNMSGILWWAQNIAAKQVQLATSLLPTQILPTAGMSVAVMLVWNENSQRRELESRMVRRIPIYPVCF